MKKKYLKIITAIIAVSSLIAITVTRIASNSSNQLPLLNKKIDQLNVSTSNSNGENSQLDNNVRTAVDSEFLLNSGNAIDMPSSTSINTSTSSTNGPRGFLIQGDGAIRYVDYTGKSIWSIPASSDVISTYYNEYAKCFVVLVPDGNNFTVISIRESDGVKVSSVFLFWSSTPAFGTRYLLIPVYEANKSVKEYIITSQSSVKSSNREFYKCSINQNGTMSLTSQFKLDTEEPNAMHIILSAGSINYNNKNYLVLMCIYGDGSISYRMYINNKLMKSNFILLSPLFTYDNKWIDTNIPEIHLVRSNLTDDPNSDPIIHITGILNADVSKTYIQGGYYSITNNAFALGHRLINLQQSNVLDYDIYRGRFYGDYLYAFLGYANYGQGAKNNKIMRLKVSEHWSSDWSTNGLKWDGRYSNARIVLYDYPNSVSANQILAQPIYQPNQNYGAFPNLFTIVHGSRDFRFLDGTKAAYAYDTRAKKSNTITIHGVQNIYVKEANSDLKTYLTNELFAANFTQYQSGTSWSVVKKTSADALVENRKGNILATLTIDKAYANNSFSTTSKKIDIVLIGFKPIHTISIQAPNKEIFLPDWYSFQALESIPLTRIKAFIWSDILVGSKEDISENNITNIKLSSQPYDNKNGKLILDSITLNKWYDEEGIEQNTEKVFSLPNNAKIEILGFKKVENFTSIKPSDIVVTGHLTSLIPAQVSSDQIHSWIQLNKNLVFDNLAPNSEVIDISDIEKNAVNGTISLSLTLNNYFDNDVLFTYNNNSKIFYNITLKGFKVYNLATHTQAPSVKVTGTLTTILAQSLNNDNLDFKQYLFDNVIVDPTKNITANNIVDFQGSYNNIRGLYILSSITMNKAYDANGNEINHKVFDSLSYSIEGFLQINETKTITSPLLVSEFANTNINDNNDQLILAWLQKNDNFKKAFIDNSLPPQFNENNIISVTTIKDSIIASTGTLKVKIVINYFYAQDGIGTLQNSESNPFELTITGFKTNSLATSVITNPTAIVAFPNASNILAENVDFMNDEIGFKDYLFEHVLIDPFKNTVNGLSLDNITNINDVVANNIEGKLTFKLEVDKRTDINGDVINGAYTFSNLITIEGFKKISPTSAITTPLSKGNALMLAENVTKPEYTKVIVDNYQTIFTNLPDHFDPNTNITSIDKVSANNDKGILVVNVMINLYYIETTGLITSNPQKQFEITISGYQSTLLTINNRVDVNNMDNKYVKEIAGASLLNQSNYTELEVMTSWLRNDAIFSKVIPDPKGLTKNDFSVVAINKIDNYLGEIEVILDTTGSFANNDNQLTFFGFRKAMNINDWINRIKTIAGSAVTVVDQTKDILDWIVKTSKSVNSPFAVPLTDKDVNISLTTRNHNFNIAIRNTNGYVNETGTFDTSTQLITFATQYKINNLGNSTSGVDDWVYPIIFSVVGVVVFLILLWIIVAAFKRRRQNRPSDISDDDYGMYL